MLFGFGDVLFAHFSVIINFQTKEEKKDREKSNNILGIGRKYVKENRRLTQ